MRTNEEKGRAADRAAAKPHDSGITTRIVLVTLLSFMLIGAVRWAIDVTDANAKQVSRNLTHIQADMDANTETGSGLPVRANSNNKTRRKRTQSDAPR